MGLLLFGAANLGHVACMLSCCHIWSSCWIPPRFRGQWARIPLFTLGTNCTSGFIENKTDATSLCQTDVIYDVLLKPLTHAGVATWMREFKTASCRGSGCKLAWLGNIRWVKQCHKSFGNGLYHLFMMIFGMVYSCFTHIDSFELPWISVARRRQLLLHQRNRSNI